MVAWLRVKRFSEFQDGTESTTPVTQVGCSSYREKGSPDELGRSTGFSFTKSVPNHCGLPNVIFIQRTM